MNNRAALRILMFLSVFCIISVSLQGQYDNTQAKASGDRGARLRPGALYAAGKTIYAPRFGFSSVVPKNWEGTLPMDTEIFLLLPTPQSTGAEIYTFASDQHDILRLKESWMQGVSLSESIRIKATGIEVEGDMISSEVVPDGDMVNKGTKGFAAARCSPFGGCITSIGIGPVHTYPEMKLAVQSFMSSASFSEPSNVSIYVDFNWKEFLSGKTLVSLADMQGSTGEGTKENVFHLCSDGSFTGRIKKKGAMKEINSQYKGKQSGTWSTESIGETGTITLNFNKLPAVELPISIKDEKIFVNQERYFAAKSDQCND